MKYSKTADLLCEMGRFGQKTGAGWYDYQAGKRDAIPSAEVNKMIEDHRKALGITPRKISDDEIVQRLVFSLVNEGAHILEEGIANKASDIDMVYLTGYGFPLHRGGPMCTPTGGPVQRGAGDEALCPANPLDDAAFWKPAPLLAKAGGRRQDLQLTTRKAKPIMLMAHQDVVPMAPGTEGDWEVPPFAGEVKDGFVWGRGSWDDKGNLIAQMEAVEMLVASGYKPPRTIYLAFGADEEVGGLRGAEARLPPCCKSAACAGLCARRRPADHRRHDARPGQAHGADRRGREGLPVGGAQGVGHAGPLVHAAAQGHQRHCHDECGAQAAGRRTVAGGIRGVAGEMFDTMAPEMGGFQRVALSNLWLFGPVVQKQLEGRPAPTPCCAPPRR
jgi:hypothetical protein